MSEAQKPLFIPAGTDARGASGDVSALIVAERKVLQKRWNSPEGQRILAKIKKAKLSRESLTENVGLMDGRYDLRGAPLSGLDLSGVVLTDVDFYAADLSKSNFTGGDLSNSHFSESNLKGADLSWAKLRECFFDRVEFDDKTNLLGVNTNEINSNLAILLIDQANTQQRIAHIKSRHRLMAAFLWITCDYGRSISRLLLWFALVIVTFGINYWLVPGVADTADLLDAMYFSVVTTTTLGYGDISPISGVGKVLVMIQVSLGYILGGLLVAIIARRVITLHA